MDNEVIKSEIEYMAVRSGGPGGQHANKVSSKVVLILDIENSNGLTRAEKVHLLDKLSGRMNKKKQLLLTCDESRSQHKNKQIVTSRCLSILEGGLKAEKKRIPTSIKKTQKIKRLEAKKRHGQLKSLRKRPKFDS